MKTTALKKNCLRFTMVCLLFVTLLMISCSENSEEITDDTALIEQIESATNRQVVSEEDLPTATTTVFDNEYADSYVKSAVLIPNLGYKVTTLTDNSERLETESDIFFDTEGRFLNDARETSIRRRHQCFRFVFPITFIMPDDSAITLNTRADWVLIRQWYRAHPDANERPNLVFPVDIMFRDGEVQIILDATELWEVKKACKEDRDKKKCFRLVLPVTFTMPDDTSITVNTKDDWSLLRQWYIAHPDVTERPELNYPVDIMYRDNTIVTINDQAEMLAAKEDCRNNSQ